MFLTRDALEITKKPQMQAKSETNIQTFSIIECSFAKVPSNQCLFWYDETLSVRQ